MGQYREPWQPEIGQRVRVRLSGECQMTFRRFRHQQSGRELLITPQPHLGQEEGRFGTVDEIDRCNAGGHSYVVLLDEAVPVPGTRLLLASSAYAAIELEPAE